MYCFSVIFWYVVIRFCSPEQIEFFLIPGPRYYYLLTVAYVRNTLTIVTKITKISILMF